MLLIDVNPNKTKNIFNREEGHGFIPTAKAVDIRPCISDENT